jgi:hypothetical protein
VKRRKHRAATHGFAGELISDAKLMAEVMTRCEWCGSYGPKARLPAHERIDHIDKGETRPPRHYCPEIPGRFKKVLDVMERRSGRTPGQMIEAALDEWLDGRRPVGFRKRVSTVTHWGETA